MFRWTIDGHNGSVNAASASDALTLFGAASGVTAREDGPTRARGELWSEHTGFAAYDVIAPNGEHVAKMERHAIR